MCGFTGGSASSYWLVVILAGALFYGTITFENSNSVYKYCTLSTKYSIILLHCTLEYISLGWPELIPTPRFISGDTPYVYADVSPMLRIIICPCFPNLIQGEIFPWIRLLCAILLYFLWHNSSFFLLVHTKHQTKVIAHETDHWQSALLYQMNHIIEDPQFPDMCTSTHPCVQVRIQAWGQTDCPKTASRTRQHH